MQYAMHSIKALCLFIYFYEKIFYTLFNFKCKHELYLVLATTTNVKLKNKQYLKNKNVNR